LVDNVWLYASIILCQYSHDYKSIRLNRRALTTTDNELKLMAVTAIMGNRISWLRNPSMGAFD